MNDMNNTEITSINDVTPELRAEVIAAIEQDNAPSLVVIAQQFNLNNNVVRMIDLRRKADKMQSGTTAAAEVNASRVGKLQALKDKIHAEEQQAPVTPKAKVTVTETVQAVQQTEVKQRAPRSPAVQKDLTKRDVVIVTSAEKKLSWLTGNILFTSASDSKVLNEMRKFAQTRKRDKDAILTLANAEDAIIERELQIEFGEQEAVMAGVYDKRIMEGYTMIGRRPKGFAAAPAPRAKKSKVELVEAPTMSAADANAALASLLERKMRAVPGMNTVSASKEKETN